MPVVTCSSGEFSHGTCTPSWRIRFAFTTVAALVLLFGVAPVAGADPAEPGNYRSMVEWITPRTAVISAKVVGGDGFLDLHVQPGNEVDIPGYTGEPWLRIDRKGTVRENWASSAAYLNESRYGSAANTQIPAWVSIKGATAHPDWRVVGHGGHYVWHDHRIHYMTPQIAPPIVPGTNRVAIGVRNDGRWVIPVIVNGRDHQIVGQLLYETPPSPLPQWSLAALVFAVLAALGLTLRARSLPVAAVAHLIIGGLAIWAGASELQAVPKLAGGNPIWVGLPVASVLAAGAALILRSPALRSITLLAASAALGVWSVLRVPAFDKSVPLGSLDPTLTRLIAAGSLGVAAGAIVVAIASGGLALRLPDLDGDETNAAGSETADRATSTRDLEDR